VREVFAMWKYTKMVVLVAMTAAFYAALVIPLKGIPIVPGFTEFRPGAVIPVVFGLLFGPAGAWGAAFGNVIGDFFGTFGIGTLFGFFGNFLYGFVGYKVWPHMGLASSREDLLINSWEKGLNFVLISVLSSVACAVVIAWGLESVNILPFAALGPIIATNNTLACLVLGIPLMRLLYNRLDRWDLVWFAIMDERDSPQGRTPRLGTALIWLGVLGGFIMGIAISVGATDTVLFTIGSGTTTPSVMLGVTPFIILLVLGCILV